MKILFLTILKIDDITDRGIYPDLMRKFISEGHEVFIVTPTERKYKQKTTLIRKNNCTILKIRTLNIQKTNPLEKWLSMYTLNNLFKRGINRFLPDINFDLILYSTPPITFSNLVIKLKEKNNAVAYLLLKDIFPQNAVDLGYLKEGGLIHLYLTRKEQKLYRLSDYIGCMSKANVDYLKKNNPEIDPGKIEINPNSHEYFEEEIPNEQKLLIRKKYNIPASATLFIYGGNLGKPQGVGFIIDFLNTQKEKDGVFFVIAGSGTEYRRINSWIDLNRPRNIILISELPKNDYNMLLQSSDAGMIFLDNRFTVPNFPSRMLSYMEHKLPVLAATDRTTDLGKIIEENGFGLWSESGDLHSIDQHINLLSGSSKTRQIMGQKGYEFFKENYTVDFSYRVIIRHFEKYL
jgi:glycosyltransferase involved in cell wall biosynthesis